MNVLDAVAAAFHGRQTLSIVDLGSGTGPTVPALGAAVPGAEAVPLNHNGPVLQGGGLPEASGQVVGVRTG